MTLLIDAAPIVGAADRKSGDYETVMGVLTSEPGPFVIPAPVTAEIDYLLGKRIGPAARRAFLADLAAGRFEVASLTQQEHALAADVDRRYADLALGLADLSLVVLAVRLRTTRILTFDERHFRAVEPLQGGAFTILPADA